MADRLVRSSSRSMNLSFTGVASTTKAGPNDIRAGIPALASCLRLSAVTALVARLVPVVMPVAVTVGLVIIPVVVHAAISDAPAALPTIYIEELVPVQAPIVLERRAAVPLAERLIAFQPARHMVGSTFVDAPVRLIMRRWLVHVAYLLCAAASGEFISMRPPAISTTVITLFITSSGLSQCSFRLLGGT